MKTIIKENERGFLFKKGAFAGLLKPGLYHTFGASFIEVVPLDAPVSSANCPLETLLADADVRAETSSVEVDDESVAFHLVGGVCRGVLTSGTYVFWNAGVKHEFTVCDTTEPEIASLPQRLFEKLPRELRTVVTVGENEVGRLYFDEKFVRLLDAGVYRFWNRGVSVRCEKTSIRPVLLTVSGQELLTSDKVTIRTSFVFTRTVTDPRKIVMVAENPDDALYVEAQLALRDYIGSHKLDEILENRTELASFVGARLKAKAEAWRCITVDSFGVKDIILPGEIREIMNSVLAAEKKAQANVITRREEVASTRSLLNTAKLLEENDTLRRLKELEYLERICQHVDCLSLNGQGDALSQLAALIGGGNARKD